MKTAAFSLLVVIVGFIVVTKGCGRENKPPSVSCPSVRDVIAPALTTSARVNWRSPSVEDDDDGWTLRLVGAKGPGSLFSQGKHTITYQVVDKDDENSVCSFSFHVKVVRCSYLPRPDHGQIVCNTPYNIYGRRCEFSCQGGFQLDGSSTSVCQRDGTNSQRAPTCRRKGCGVIDMPPMSDGVNCTHERYHDSVCLLACKKNEGYEPRLFSFAKCLSNSTWKYENWMCEDTEKPRILNCPTSPLRTSDKTFVWPTISASDNSGTVNLTQKRGQRPGSELKDGAQIIEYNAVDPSGNKAPACVFSVIYEALNSADAS